MEVQYEDYIKENFNFFIFIYSIYTFLDIIFFHNLQGSKLKLKKELINKNK